MKHQKQGRKFGRKKGQRVAFKKSLMTNLIEKERISTTEARAKEIKPAIEKLVSKAKKQDVAALRLLIARLSQKPALKLFYDIAPRYKERPGGYTRIIKTATIRKGDAAGICIIEFV